MASLVPQEASKSLNGPQKVAALLLSLDKEIAHRVLKYFDAQDLRSLAKHASTLGAVGAQTLDPLIDDLIEQLSGPGPDVVGSASKAEQLLSGLIPEEDVAEIMSEVLGSANQFFWQKLTSVPEATLVSYLAQEHSQTIAVILSKIDTAAAAKLLSHLPAGRRNVVMRRMLVSRPIADSTLRIMQITLDEDLVGSGSSSAQTGAKMRVAGIMNQMERDQMNEVIETIEAAEPAIAQQLKALLFSFEDIPKLSERARAILFDQVPTDRVILSLRGADEIMRGAVLPVLGARVRRMIEAELASSDLPPKRDIARAQRQVAEAALRLAEQGLIEISGESAGDEG
jgi:flagellar motor switch protein FliG